MSELLDMDPTFACDVIYSLLEAIPGQTEDRDWWPDELTRAVAAAKAYLKQTCVCDPNVNYFDGECIAPGRAYRARIAELEALTRWRPIAEAPKHNGWHVAKAEQQDALEQIKQGKCPFGYLKDGESIAHCPLGFPGCNCADEMEQSAEFELADLEAENATLRGAMAADDERLRLAGERVGCDTAEWMADEIEALRARIATLDEALKRVYSLVTFQLAEPPNDTGALVEIATVIETVPGIAERGGL